MDPPVAPRSPRGCRTPGSFIHTWTPQVNTGQKQALERLEVALAGWVAVGQHVEVALVGRAGIKRVARLIKYYWDGVITAATTNVTNARSEGMNSKIQWIKRMACGYRNRQRFHNAIYFHLGGLDLYPDSLNSTHTEA